jgi:hypothetical protein
MAVSLLMRGFYRRGRAGSITAGALALVLAVACRQPAVPHALANQLRYTCCNLHYEKPDITDINYLRGTVIPFGTRVQIVEVGSDRVTFETAGHPPITLRLKYGAGTLSMDEYLARIFLVDDPYARLPRSAGGGAEAAEADNVRRLIEEGTIRVGMTREQVLMALAYPPAHRTPRLDAPVWTYWADRDDTFRVYFDGDKVSRVSRPDGERRRRR